jgi:hypothetical protein
LEILAKFQVVWEILGGSVLLETPAESDSMMLKTLAEPDSVVRETITKSNSAM